MKQLKFKEIREKLRILKIKKVKRFCKKWKIGEKKIKIRKTSNIEIEKNG